MTRITWKTWGVLGLFGVVVVGSIGSGIAALTDDEEPLAPSVSPVFPLAASTASADPAPVVDAMAVADQAAVAVATPAPDPAAPDPAAATPGIDPAATSAGVDPGPTYAPGQGRFMMMRRRMEDLRPTTNPVAEWDELMAFLSENSPTRAGLLKDVDPAPGSALREATLKKWHAFKLMQENSPALAALNIEKFKVEDQVLAMSVAMRKDPSQREALRDQVRDAESKLVDLNRKAHQQRIDSLTKLLADEKAKLADEEGRRDELIEQRTNSVLEHRGLAPGFWAVPAGRPMRDRPTAPPPPKDN